MNRFNGEAVAGAWTGTRALHYGDGVFRTALVHGHQVIDLNGQLEKLLRDAAALDLEVPDPDLLRSEMQALAGTVDAGVLRVLLSRADSGRGYVPAANGVDRLLQLRPLPEHARDCWTQGVVLGWSPVLLGVQPRLAGIKHLNRLEQVLASRGWPEGQHEALMCDADGRVTCGTRSNVFFVIDNILVTPDLSRAGVAGRTRERVFQIASAIGRDCEVGTISPDEVRHATECFLTNSLVGIWPVRRIGTLELAAPGPVTRSLTERLAHPWCGR